MHLLSTCEFLQVGYWEFSGQTLSAGWIMLIFINLWYNVHSVLFIAPRHHSIIVVVMLILIKKKLNWAVNWIICSHSKYLYKKNHKEFTVQVNVF